MVFGQKAKVIILITESYKFQTVGGVLEFASCLLFAAWTRIKATTSYASLFLFSQDFFLAL